MVVVPPTQDDAEAFFASGDEPLTRVVDVATGAELATFAVSDVLTLPADTRWNSGLDWHPDLQLLIGIGSGVVLVDPEELDGRLA